MKKFFLMSMFALLAFYVSWVTPRIQPDSEDIPI